MKTSSGAGASMAGHAWFNFAVATDSTDREHFFSRTSDDVDIATGSIKCLHWLMVSGYTDSSNAVTMESVVPGLR